MGEGVRGVRGGEEGECKEGECPWAALPGVGAPALGIGTEALRALELGLGGGQVEVGHAELPLGLLHRALPRLHRRLHLFPVGVELLVPVEEQLARLTLHELEALAHVLDAGCLNFRPRERILVRLLNREE